jgi:hypothetical protein
VGASGSGGVVNLVAINHRTAGMNNQTSHRNLLRAKENPDGTLPPG